MACCSTPNLEGQSTIFLTTGAGLPSYNPRHQVTHFGYLLQPAWAAVGLSFTPVTTWGITEMYDTIKTFKVKLWQWENQNCTPLSTFHTWHLFAPFIISKNKNVALRRVQQFQQFRIMNAEFLLFPLALKVDTEKLQKTWKWD
jgi:hypothetical protein